LLASNRYAAILGTLLTILLALIFTGLQAFEYAQSSITIADSVFGSAFFCATGLHGYNLLPLSIYFNYPTKSKTLLNNYKYSTNFPIKKIH
jgi:heme/copper-type cytochrome/quinol oxidase subunit 3